MPAPRGLGLAAVAATAAAGLGWGVFESQWVERIEVDVPLEGLPPELDGFSILHLSDFHLGSPSLNARALERAVEWAEEERFDLVAVTGDLLTRRRGERHLRTALRRLRARHGVVAVLGNHDVAATRDPFSEPTDASGVVEGGATLLEDSDLTFPVAGRTVQIAGLDPEGWELRRPGRLADPGADLRILLAHFPDATDRLPPGAFHLILAGHLHGGQICLPAPWGKVRLEHLRAPYWDGLHLTEAGALHVSRGLGTSFVPFRFLARPEATKLVLRKTS